MTGATGGPPDDDLPAVPAHVLHPEADGPGTSAAALRADVRRAARRLPGAGLGDLLGDVYTGVLAVALTALVLSGSPGRLGALGGVPSDAAGGTGLGVAGVPAPLLAAAGVLLLVGGVVGLLARLGPLSLPPARAAWWLPLPVDRGALLRPVLPWRVLPAAVVAGALVAALGVLVLPAGTGAVAPLALAAGAVVALLVAAAVVEQAGDRPPSAVRRVADAAVLAAPLLVVVAAADDVLLGRPAVDAAAPAAADPTGGGVAAIAAVVAVALVVAGVVVALVARRRAGRVPAAALTASGALTAQVTGSGLLLDTRALGRALAGPGRPVPGGRARRAGRRGAVPAAAAATRSRPARAVARGPVGVLVVADVLAVVREPRRVVTAAVLALLPGAVAVAAGGSTWPALLAVAACTYAAATTLAEPVRHRVVVPALDAVLPISAGAAAWAHLLALVLLTAVPTTAAALVLELLAPGALPAWLVVASAPGVAAAALRGAARAELDPSTAVVATAAGPVPLGVVTHLLRGPDLVLVALLPLALGALAADVAGGLAPATTASLALVALLLGLGLGAVAAAGARPRPAERDPRVAAAPGGGR